MKNSLVGIVMVVSFGTAIAKNNDKCDAHLVRINPDNPPAAVVRATSPAVTAQSAAAAKPATAPAASDAPPVEVPPLSAAQPETGPEPAGLSVPAPTGTTAPGKKSKSPSGPKKVTAITAPAQAHRTMGDYMFAEELP